MPSRSTRLGRSAHLKLRHLLGCLRCRALADEARDLEGLPRHDWSALRAAMDDTAPSVGLPSTPVEDYRVLSELGAGGMGRVFLVRHRRDGTLRAVKTLKHRSESTGRPPARRGPQPGALRHDKRGRGVIGVSTWPTNPRWSWSTSPDRPSRISRRPIARCRRTRSTHWAAACCGGWSQPTNRGWVHRDLKPANVLIAKIGEVLVPKVTDFGLVKILDEDGAAQAGSTTLGGVGTRRYMSLEQLCGAPPDQRMDVFSLGALLFELIEGRPAFPTVEAGIAPCAWAASPSRSAPACRNARDRRACGAGTGRRTPAGRCRPPSPVGSGDRAGPIPVPPRPRSRGSRTGSTGPKARHTPTAAPPQPPPAHRPREPVQAEHARRSRRSRVRPRSASSRRSPSP